MTLVQTASPPRQPLGRLRRIFFYGSTRGLSEALLAARGLVLATVLGPSLFGIWVLFRLGSRYASFGELGVRRGLEFEASRLLEDDSESVAVYGRATISFLTLVFGGFGAVALAASAYVADPTTAMVLQALAIGVFAARIWQYGMTYIRARTSLRLFAIIEVTNALMHLGLSASLALVWGLGGAIGGYLVATGVSALLVSLHVPMRPEWNPRALKRLLGIGFPVSLTLLATMLLSTVDRLAVAAMGGTTLLGYYAFAAALGGLTGSFAWVIRTVVFPELYQAVTTHGSKRAISRLVEEAITPYATLFPVLLGFAAFAVGPAVSLIVPQYLTAVPAARLFLFHGSALGFSALGTLGLIAASRQWVLPAVAGGVAILNAGLAIGLLRGGFGLEAVAATALLARIVYGGSVVALAVSWSESKDPGRVVMRTLLPLLYCASLVYGLGHWLPGNGLEQALASSGIYALAMIPLMPFVWRELRSLEP